MSFKKFSGNKNRILVAMLALVVTATLATMVGMSVFAQKGKNGTTLAAAKTLEICDNGDGTWTYKGEIAVWNEGAVNTVGFAINDWIQVKCGSGQFQNSILVPSSNISPAVHEVAAGTTQATADVYTYYVVGSPVDLTTCSVRNVANLTILNHSGQTPGTPFGPSPKQTWSGGTPGPCIVACGCTYTQGYWGNKPGVVWPAPYDRNALFFNSGLTWQQILDASAGGNGYIILGKQYIAAVLNQANNACVPSGVQDILTLATGYFTGATTPGAACPLNSSCGTQKAWGGILDSYNNGLYPGGPSHCGDE